MDSRMVNQNASGAAARPPGTVARQLEAWIAAQHLLPGARLPAERPLAAQLGVPRSAVNLAVLQLCAQGRLRHEGRKLILAQPARTAQLPPLWVAALLPLIERAARDWATDTGHEVRLLGEHDPSLLPGRVLRLAEEGCAGLLLWSTPHAAALHDLLRRHQVPCVLGGAALAGLTSVLPDHFLAARQAVDYLVGLGHKQLAFAGAADAPGDYHKMWLGYQAACAAHGLPPGDCLPPPHPATASALRAYGATLRHRRPRPTALVCANELTAIELLPILKQQGWRVPAELSLVACEYTLRRSDPAVTVLRVNDAEIARLALALLARLVAERQRGAPPAPPVYVRVEPRLMVRGTTAPPPAVARRAPPRRAPTVPPATAPAPYIPLGARALLLPPAERRRLVAATWADAYPTARAADPAAFTPVDLHRWTNRLVGRSHGWLGDKPLRHLPAPLLHAHGVPFHLHTARGSNGVRAVVVRANAAARHLPEEVVIPLHHTVRAVYFLHGCGFAITHAVGGAYDLHAADGQVTTLPLIPWGADVLDAAERARRDQHATIQDWWPALPQFTQPHARHVVITADGDPTLYERYLYTLEWRNPRPAVPLTALHVRVFGAPPFTLGLLAVTLLA